MKLTYAHVITAVNFAIISHVHFTVCLEWVVEDGVHLTAEIETRSPEETELAAKFPGGCLKLRQCYPILFLTDRTDKDDPSSINSDLIDFILETSDPCKPEGYVGTGNENKTFTDPGDLYVWCRLKSVANKESVRPAVVQVKAEDDGNFCGQSTSFRGLEEEERVVGGTEITAGDAPYLVAMLFKGKQVCGGSIIDEHHVLTAAHCVSHLKPAALYHLRLLIGDHNIRDLADTDHQERNVSKIIYHKEFSRDTLHDDIAMIKLSEPIQYTSTVSPVCLNDNSNSIEEGTTTGKIVGWGQVEVAGSRPTTPRTANLRIWKTEDCEDIYDSVVSDDIFEKAFCAGGFQDGGMTDACRGDSGGPMTIVRNKKHWQIGIVSFGIGCGRYPGVFTKVSEYQSWIDRHRTFVVANE